jgi:CMP-N-acetylneuraminic acid synthetase
VNVLGLIPARGGSKGIPRKNIAPCGGKPLIGWTCDAARGAACLTRTIVSTDDAEIAEVARAHGVEAPFLRPAELSSDTAKSVDVANHALDWLEREQGWRADVLVLLQPTSPMRVARHIDEAFALLVASVDSVASVVEVPHRYKPWAILELDDGLLRYVERGDLPFDRQRRQGQPTLYTRNGPVVVVTHTRAIRAGSHYGERSAAYVMSHADSIDIDDPYDLELADWALRRREDQR